MFYILYTNGRVLSRVGILKHKSLIIGVVNCNLFQHRLFTLYSLNMHCGALDQGNKTAGRSYICILCV
jgi:hypothetical protein